MTSDPARNEAEAAELGLRATPGIATARAVREGALDLEAIQTMVNAL